VADWDDPGGDEGGKGGKEKIKKKGDGAERICRWAG